MLEAAPYLHYMVKVFRPRPVLVSPAESDAAAGGCFVVPVQPSGRLFPLYRFDFSIYLGNGEFLKGPSGKGIFQGLAFLVGDKQQVLLTAFGYPPPFWPGLSRTAFKPFWFPVHPESGSAGDIGLMPTFRPVNGRHPPDLLKYAGDLQHPDFAHKFVELQPAEPAALDELLERWGVSLVGCDPFTRYAGLLTLNKLTPD